MAVQMHNLQHKFLRCILRRRASLHTPTPNSNVRVSLVQAAMFYHYRETADRRDKVGRLLEIALGDLQDSATIEELSQALTKHGVDINSHAGQHGENPNTFPHTL